MPKRPSAIDQKILAWYDRESRDLPWRANKGQRPNPYAVWVSEIMLQQTTVPAVMKYFPRFIARFPDAGKLASAKLDDVLNLWQGLGYYARARNLHKCAQILVRDYNGKFPTTKEELKKLPGIGDYTAGAITAIAFDLPEYAVDANVERVIARLFAIQTPLPKAKIEIKHRAGILTPQKRPGDYLQAMMDLGATVCAVENPQCGLCPLSADCRARAMGIAAQLPVKIKKTAKPVRYGWALLVRNSRGQILLQKRVGKSMLGGMVEVPSSHWDRKDAEKKSAHDLPKSVEWKKLKNQVRHSFTHFDLHLDLYSGEASKNIFKDAFWHDPANLDQVALPTLFKKVLRQISG